VGDKDNWTKQMLYNCYRFLYSYYQKDITPRLCFLHIKIKTQRFYRKSGWKDDISKIVKKKR